jgi:hypothetical protein
VSLMRRSSSVNWSSMCSRSVLGAGVDMALLSSYCSSG